MILGPIAAKFLDPKRWGSAAADQQDAITLGVMRVMIGIQLCVRPEKSSHEAGFEASKTKWQQLTRSLLFAALLLGTNCPPGIFNYSINR